MKKYFYFPFLIFIICNVLFFNPFFLQGKLPIPADTIVGLYHPFRDLYSDKYPSGIPYKNFLITDPVRQQIPWKSLSIETEKKGTLPLWNPYNFSGTPLLANFQSASFYPFNILFFILPFSIAWSILIISQPFLAGVFLYFYLRNLRLSKTSAFLGGVTFAFSGFSIAWLEWGNIVSTGLWLPLILLSIDKIFSFKLKTKNYFIWSFIFIFSITASFLAGHLQIFLYTYIFSLFYFIARWFQFKKNKKILFTYIILNIFFIILTSAQWIPTLQFINLSARNIDQFNWQQTEGWFIPWRHLIQFVAPDFFGNPTTLNYYGTWNYGELVGYVGIVPIIFSLFSLFFRRDKKTLFFTLLFFLSLIFSLPTIFAKLPYILQIPFLSTSQPTRLLFLTDFSLSVLAVLGMDFYCKHTNKKQILIPLVFLSIVFAGLWIFVTQNSGENIIVSKRNLYLPSILFILAFLIFLINLFVKQKKLQRLSVVALLLLTIFDLLRFGQKFTPFTNQEYLFPSTKTISYLQKNNDNSRIMSTDSRILPPNFSSIYHLQSIEGYDPLYLKNYAELMAASERGKPDIYPPFGFNRIITPQNINSPIINLLGVKYVLSFADLPAPQFIKVFQEGQTKLYKNAKAFPRAFFVANVKVAETKQKTIDLLFDKTIDLHKTAIVETEVGSSDFGQGNAKITYYSENKVVIETNNPTIGFLVLTDSYYPTWKAKICSAGGKNCQGTKIYLADYNFRGVIVPSGSKSIEFYNTLL